MSLHHSSFHPLETRFFPTNTHKINYVTLPKARCVYTIEGEEHVFVSRDFVFLFCYLPGEIEIPSLELGSVCGLGTELTKGWVHITPDLLSLRWKDLSYFFLPNQILLLFNNDPSREISQTSETWEFVSGILEAHVFQMESLEEGVGEWEEAGGWKMGEAWTLDHFWLPWSLPSWQCARPEETAVVPLRLCQWWLGSHYEIIFSKGSDGLR